MLGLPYNKPMLTKSLEDYLEFIFNSLEENKILKAIDIANYFKISRASVSEALIRLTEANLIIYHGRNGIELTNEGKKQAKRIIKKHEILSNFFFEILNLPKETSSSSACKIEHVIEEEVISRLEEFTVFCRLNNIDKIFLRKLKEK